MSNKSSQRSANFATALRTGVLPAPSIQTDPPPPAPERPAIAIVPAAAAPEPVAPAPAPVAAAPASVAVPPAPAAPQPADAAPAPAPVAAAPAPVAPSAAPPAPTPPAPAAAAAPAAAPAGGRAKRKTARDRADQTALQVKVPKIAKLQMQMLRYQAGKGTFDDQVNEALDDYFEKNGLKRVCVPPADKRK